MKLILLLIIIIISGFRSLPAAADSTWSLVWYDEFDGTGIPDGSKWDRPEYNRRNNDSGPDGWWLQEDSYLDGQGNLVIRCRQIDDRNADGDPFDYSTGAVRSYGKFEQAFGKFEASCMLPSQPGWWIAFWLYSQSVGNVDGSGEDGAEIDVMEGFGWNDRINQALHWDGYGEFHQSAAKATTIEGLHEGYHTYTLEWSADEYLFLVDGNETWRTDTGGVSKVPAYVKITGELSTESWATNEYWSNDPANAQYPDYFLVDWVRVYEKAAVGVKEGSGKGDGRLFGGLCANVHAGGASIGFTLDQTSDIEVDIFDCRGRLVRKFAGQRMAAGKQTVEWNLENEQGSRVPVGSYIVNLLAGKTCSSGKLVVMN